MLVELLMVQFSINLKDHFEVADIDYIAGIAATNPILMPNSVERRLFRSHRTFLELSSSLALCNAFKFVKQFSYTLYSSKMKIA